MRASLRPFAVRYSPAVRVSRSALLPSGARLAGVLSSQTSRTFASLSLTTPPPLDGSAPLSSVSEPPSASKDAKNPVKAKKASKHPLGSKAEELQARAEKKEKRKRRKEKRALKKKQALEMQDPTASHPPPLTKPTTKTKNAKNKNMLETLKNLLGTVENKSLEGEEGWDDTPTLGRPPPRLRFAKAPLRPASASWRSPFTPVRPAHTPPAPETHKQFRPDSPLATSVALLSLPPSTTLSDLSRIAMRGGAKPTEVVGVQLWVTGVSTKAGDGGESKLIRPTNSTAAGWNLGGTIHFSNHAAAFAFSAMPLLVEARAPDPTTDDGEGRTEVHLFPPTEDKELWPPARVAKLAKALLRRDPEATRRLLRADDYADDYEDAQAETAAETVADPAKEHEHELALKARWDALESGVAPPKGTLPAAEQAVRAEELESHVPSADTEHAALEAVSISEPEEGATPPPETVMNAQEVHAEAVEADVPSSDTKHAAVSISEPEDAEEGAVSAETYAFLAHH
ncbi:hypothetical protein FB451DRAFT_197868 [Mycena latifolia]|nr:hypothetical protein FB451DRAFT_197868 [Mycena latifolia]